MVPILGFDYGNYYSQLIYILNMDLRTRRGGTPLDLSDPTSPDPNGTPTAFFRSARRNEGQPICGFQATMARPAANIVRYLKRNIEGSVTLDGVTYTYAEMITQTIQHCVREANRQLHAQTQQTTNQIALAYPATFDAKKRALLISLAEKATLEDGRSLKVVGTITEPAAAALDYLAEYPAAKAETCVMCYDLGAGTFDLSVVEAFPSGKRAPSGNTYYYDARWTGGDGKLGGMDFDKLLYELIIKKMGIKPTGTQVDRLMQIAETTKRVLTRDDRGYASFETPDGDVFEVEISIEEFNAAARPLVQKTVDMVKHALASPNIPRPDLILLTGGASQMRLVKQMLEEALPAYRDKIVFHRPSKAIAMGAARFASVEENNGIEPPDPVLVQRTTLELGTVFTGSDNHDYIEVLIPQGTPIPYTSEEINCRTRFPDQSRLDMSVQEAVNATPDRRQPARDYHNVMPYTYDLHRSAKDEGKHHLSAVCQLVIDEKNVMYMRVWEPGRKEQTLDFKKCTYKEWDNP